MMRHVHNHRDIHLKLLPEIGDGKEFRMLMVLSPQTRFQKKFSKNLFLGFNL